MILTGFIKDTFAAKRLLQFSTHDDLPFIHLDYSYRIFNVIENPDASVYNIMMMAYVERNYPHRAIPFYKLMLNRNVGPNVYTYPFLVEACAIQKSEFEGKQMHNHVFKLGFGFDVHVRSTLVDMYADCWNTDDARMVFDEGPMMGSFVWFSLLERYIGDGDLERAEYIYNLMPEKNTTASTFMIVNFTCYFYTEKIDKLISEIPENDTDSWSDIIYCFQARNREMYEEALDIFINMHADGVSIDELVVEAVLLCVIKFARLRNLKMMGKLIHSLVVKIGIECDVELQNSLMGMYSACGQILSAQKLFNGICWFDKYGWHRVLSGYLKCGLLGKAKALFESRPEEIWEVSWTVMIKYFSRHGCFFEALELFQEMMRSGIRLDEHDLCNIIIDLPYRYGALDLGKCIHAYLIKNGYCLKGGSLDSELSCMYSSCECEVMKDERRWQ
ncbi:hypothetical protein FNV43_RR03879 [Rhamnella rubrinervis]|uniref:Pentatricopeptide repeat-containing protein n=1 Tax=Rhamnella rubrinervis TaxID=2594499 RepID=A0A8K0MPI5_9ROSA|nr:hypothetical protein FNV43_RR03879 [Rhamnella rubrinervis]